MNSQYYGQMSKEVVVTKGGLQRITCVPLVPVLVLLLVVGGVLPQTAYAQNATGTPINFGSIGDYRTTTQLGALLNAAAFGLNLSFGINNNVRNGVKGRPVHLNIRYNNDDENTVAGLMTDLVTNVPDLVGIAHVLGDLTILKTVEVIDALPDNQKMVLVQPSAGVRRWFSFSESYVNIIPPADAELYTGIRYFVYQHQFTRFGVVTDEASILGTELVPEIRRLLAEVGATVSYHYVSNFEKDPYNYNATELGALIASRPHAVLLNGALYPNTAATLLALLVSLPSVYVVTITGLLPLADLALKQLPANVVLGNRVLATNVGPLYSDTSMTVVQRFRAELASVATPQMNLTIIDAYPPVGTFAFLGWIMGEFIINALKRIDTISAISLRTSVFQDSIYSVDDIVFGPYSGECSGTRTLYCRCNNGARIVSMVHYTPSLTLATTPTGAFTLPLSSCDAANLSLPSPLVAATVTPDFDPSATIATADYMIGRNAAATNADITVAGALVQQSYSTVASNSTATLQYLAVERLVTAFAGSVLNTPIGDATGIGAVIDPMEVRPRLYGGFRRDVVYVSPTYEQELHALASLAVAQGKGITVLSALDEDGSAVGSTLTLSMNTLGQEGGGHRSSASIASGLLATGDGGVTILHGIATSADIAAIATHLGQQTNAVVAIPMAHLLVWYRELVAAVTDESQRSRIVFATSLPNWAGPVTGETTGPALQTYFDRVPPNNRTPGTLRGYMTHQLLTYVTGRIPNQKTPTEFLRMLYGASVVVMDTGLVAGPYFDTACVGTQSTTCEMNVGARLIRVRSLSASMTAADGTASGQDASSITLDSGRISYKSLPTTDNSLRNIIIIVAVVGGLLVIGGVVALVLVCLCSGRSNWTAPKDESEAFTIIFTDIQSSTNLWAEAPEAMAPALDHHHALIRKLCIKHRGYEVKTIGDAFMVAFKDASDAVAMSSALQFDFYGDKTWSPQIDHVYLEMDQVSIQGKKSGEKAHYSNALNAEDYGKVWNGLRVRIGIHTGFGEIKKDPVSHGYDYYGTVVNTAARTESIAHGGQVIMTEAALAASDISEDRVVPRGAVMLRGVPEPVQMFELTTVANRIFPPLRVEKAQEELDGDEPAGDIEVASVTPSARFTHSLNPAAKKHRNQIMGLLKTMFSVVSETSRTKILTELCARWRVQVPKQQQDVAATTTESSTSHLGGSGNGKDTMMKALATKLAPIMLKKSGEQRKGNGGGGGDVSSGSFALSTLGMNPVSSFQMTDGGMSPKEGGVGPSGHLQSPRQYNKDDFALSSNRGGGSGAGYLTDQVASGDLLAFSALSQHQHSSTTPINHPNGLVMREDAFSGGGVNGGGSSFTTHHSDTTVLGGRRRSNRTGSTGGGGGSEPGSPPLDRTM